MDFNTIKEFIRPELLVLVPVMYFIGMGLKKMERIKDNYIPLILGIASVLLAILFVGAATPILTYQDVLMVIFTGITQGVLCAGCSVYINQMIKQFKGIKSCD